MQTTSSQVYRIHWCPGGRRSIACAVYLPPAPTMQSRYSYRLGSGADMLDLEFLGDKVTTSLRKYASKVPKLIGETGEAAPRARRQHVG